jgi:hypothetical protein
MGSAYSRKWMIRVVFAEDTYLMREGSWRLLKPEPDIELAASVPAFA